MSSVVLLGVSSSITISDELMAESLCGRAVRVFFSSTKLLTSADAPVRQRAQMLGALVTSAVRWLVPSRPVLRKLRVQCATKLLWCLRLRTNTSWMDDRQFAAMRHIAKLWGRVCWGGLWDHLACRQHWRLLGHMLRSLASLVPKGVVGSETH